jgi:glycosyltransferase involved in cell wall biosynthesis
VNTPFSVLLSLYIKENPAFLEQALASVFEQTCPPAEAVLVLDGEITAPLQAVVDAFKEKYPSLLKIVPLEKNIGLGPALNEGLKHCSHELVARMDTDDICKPHRFEKQLAVFEQHPYLSAAGSWVDEFTDASGHAPTQRRLPERHEQLVVFARRRNPMNHPTVMFRKKDIEAVGSYQSFYLFEDYHLWARLIMGGYKLYNIQESLLCFRSNPPMIARRGGWKYAKAELKLMRTFRQSGLFGYGMFFKNVCIRFPIRIMPVAVRTFVYKKILR